LYPHIEPFAQQHLQVSELHQIYIEQSGNKNGIPVLFLHGGPGSGCTKAHRCYFDPAVYHIILFDQRGCGQSKPLGELTQNNTAALVQDIDTIRKHLGLGKCLLFGGSWGSTLGLLYAQKYPENVLSLILRGVFLSRSQDINWAYSKQGAAHIFPEAWDQLVGELPSEAQHAPLQEIYNNLRSNDEQLSRSTYNKIQQWEATMLNIAPFTPIQSGASFNKHAPLIQLHYSINRCFIDENAIVENLHKLSDIPIHIIHGRHDFVCPAEQAWIVKQRCPHAVLNIIENAGHLASEPLIINALIEATIAFQAQNDTN